MLSHVAYDVLTTLAAAPGAVYLAACPKYRPLLRRFAPRVPENLGNHPIWLQACSMGEVNAARPILEAMALRWPDTPLLLTTSTMSGWRQAHAMAGGTPTAWFPFDHRVSVSRFLDRLAPRILVLLETEVWPNAVRIARARKIPVALLNGRISDKHFTRYKRIARFWRPIFAALSAACAQNEEYAARIRVLGAGESIVHVTGNTKFDGVRTAFPEAQIDALRQQTGILPGRPVVVFGSLRTGDETLAATCWAGLRARFPDLCLVVAPRHLERVHDVCAAFDEPYLLRSETQAGRAPAGERIVVVDVMGELAAFYAMAAVAVIGGSFYPGVEGHNPLESAALGIPTVFGPYMRNFIDPAKALLESRGAMQVDAGGLQETLAGLLTEPEARARLGGKGRAAVLANQGAIERSLDILEPLLRSGRTR
ncbi:MAG TPA: glycosyltransferase N-terminal domain-containing protein [Candidatus Hydrogenedentes bacterium]|nr:glycosyltransferase N-terminal domain-containing protein [Candidatus Hydrogenedentota bacterium]